MLADIQLLREKTPINTLREECLSRLGEYTQSEEYLNGGTPFRQGDCDEDAIFLVSGRLRMQSRDGRVLEIDHKDHTARFALANLKPRLYGAEVISERARLVRVKMEILERCAALEQFTSGKEGSNSLEEHLVSEPWVVNLLRTKEFARLPITTLLQLAERAQSITVKQGQVVIRQGEPGEYFYIIAEGSCKISRLTPVGEIILDQIGPGEPFGESALLSEEPRNATITMLEDGLLKRLSRHDFKRLLADQYIPYSSPKEVRELLRSGAIPIDVRTEEEVTQYRLPNVRNIPLFLIRVRIRSGWFRPENRYVLFCDSGIRSATAAFILNQNQIPAYVAEGGLSRFGGASYS